MAQLPTPRVTGAFTSASRVAGTVTWNTQTNLSDLEQVRVRYVRILASTSSSPPQRTTVAGLAELTSTGWASFTSNSRTYQYRDDRITSGFDSTPPSYIDRTVSFNESGLSGYNVWAMSRLEV